MIDLETIATTPNATILTIGAQGFDPFSDCFSDVTFYKRILVDSQPTRHVDDDTLAWWGRQSAEAQHEAFGDGPDRVDIKEALEELSKIAFRHTRIWANGVMFDIGILEDAMKEYGVNVPWKFWQIMDARTVFKLVPSLGSAGSTNSHNALEDCVNQIDMLQRAFKKLGIPSL